MVGFPNRHLLLSGPYREAPTAFYSPTADAAGNFLPNATIQHQAATLLTARGVYGVLTILI
jgi:hypothetical protein